MTRAIRDALQLANKLLWRLLVDDGKREIELTDWHRQQIDFAERETKNAIDEIENDN